MSTETKSAGITDPEILAFIERAAAFYPEGKANMTVAQRRQRYDEMAAVFRQPRPEGLRVTDETVPGPAGDIPVRRYLPADAGPVTLVYFHGGGFVLGGLDSHDDVTAEIAARSGCPVTAVDYRRCPENPHPASYEDARAATRAALGGGPVIVSGDSAGGNLAAALALRLRGEDIRGQVLIYPCLGGNRLGLDSYAENAEAPMLTARDMAYYDETRAGGGPVPEDDPTFFPLLARDFAALPPCFVSAALPATTARNTSAACAPPGSRRSATSSPSFPTATSAPGTPRAARPRPSTGSWRRSRISPGAEDSREPVMPRLDRASRGARTRPFTHPDSEKRVKSTS